MKPLRFVISVALWSALVFVFFAMRLEQWHCAQWTRYVWGWYLCLGPVISAVLFLFADHDPRRPR